MSFVNFTFRCLVFLSSLKFIVSTTYICDTLAACGCSNVPAALTKIVGGETVLTNSWGWAVSLYIGGALCGGSIISSSWVITAAHCVSRYSASQIQVAAGSNRVWSGTQIRNVQTIYIHPSYLSAPSGDDIALLQLTTPFNFSDTRIKTVCLPSVNTSLASQWPPDSTTVVAIGWGTLTESGSLPLNLQQVTMKSINYSSTNCYPSITRRSVQFCASLPCRDTCQGDSGGPLMAFTSSQQWVLVGLTSYGVGCARPDYAGIYTRVSAYQSWIQSITSGAFNTPTSMRLTSSTTELVGSCRGSSAARLYSNFFVLSIVGIILYMKTWTVIFKV